MVLEIQQIPPKKEVSGKQIPAQKSNLSEKKPFPVDSISCRSEIANDSEFIPSCAEIPANNLQVAGKGISNTQEELFEKNKKLLKESISIESNIFHIKDFE